MTHTVYLGLGTNLGEREQNLSLARRCLRRAATVAHVANTYATPPRGIADQPDTPNLCIAIQPDFGLISLLRLVNASEASAVRRGSRTVNILQYDDRAYTAKRLTLPLSLGVSREGRLGNLSAEQRVESILATTASGIDRGADMVRVHDVKENVRATQVANALVKE